jgi:hypothetical protein
VNSSAPFADFGAAKINESAENLKTFEKVEARR